MPLGCMLKLKSLLTKVREGSHPEKHCLERAIQLVADVQSSRMPGYETNSHERCISLHVRLSHALTLQLVQQ